MTYSPPPERSYQELRLLLLCALTAIAYVWLRIETPFFLTNGAQLHDDDWFVGAAVSLAAGQWFGEYGHMTLIKGPAYPMFLAFTSATGLPLQAVSSTVHALGAATLAACLRDIFVWPVRYAAFVLLLAVQIPLQRILREELSMSLMLVSLGLLVLYFHKPGKRRILVPLALGVTIGLFGLTREDGFIVATPLVLLSSVLSLYNRPTREHARAMLVGLVVVFGASQVPVLAYKSINFQKYDEFVGVELLDSQFMGALASLMRIRAAPAKRYVEVTDENMQAAALVSPTFHAVLPELVRPGYWRSGTCWAQKSVCPDGVEPVVDHQGHRLLDAMLSDRLCPVSQDICGSIGAGNFMWALRDALSAQGRYRTATEARETFQKISMEIDRACEQGLVRCVRKESARLPGVELFNLKAYFHIFFHAIGKTLFPPRRHQVPPVSTIDAESRAAQAIKLLNLPAITMSQTSHGTYELLGWYFDRKMPERWLEVTGDGLGIATLGSGNRPQGQALIPRRYETEPGLLHSFGDPGARFQRFKFYVTCATDDCVLIINGERLGRIRDLRVPVVADSGRLHLGAITEVSGRLVYPAPRDRIDIAGPIAAFTHEWYKRLSGLMLLGGLCSLAVLLVQVARSRKTFDGPTQVVVVLWFTYFWTIGFVSLMSFYWMPSGVTDQYLYPATTILPVAVLLSALVAIGSRARGISTAAE